MPAKMAFFKADKFFRDEKKENICLYSFARKLYKLRTVLNLCYLLVYYAVIIHTPSRCCTL